MPFSYYTLPTMSSTPHPSVAAWMADQILAGSAHVVCAPVAAPVAAPAPAAAFTIAAGRGAAQPGGGGACAPRGR
jgi:hypothetical protein